MFSASYLIHVHHQICAEIMLKDVKTQESIKTMYMGITKNQAVFSKPERAMNLSHLQIWQQVGDNWPHQKVPELAFHPHNLHQQKKLIVNPKTGLLFPFSIVWECCSYATLWMWIFIYLQCGAVHMLCYCKVRIEQPETLLRILPLVFLLTFLYPRGFHKWYDFVESRELKWRL